MSPCTFVVRLAELQTEVELFRGAIYAAVDAMMAGQNVTLHASMIKLKLGRICRCVVCTGTGKRKVSKVAGQSLDCYCVCSELLSASIADALLLVNILVSGIFHGHFAQRLAVNKQCLQIIRCLRWKQTTTRSLRNNNPMIDGKNLLSNKYDSPSNVALIDK